MSITCKIAPYRVRRLVLVALACVLLGLLGIYDYSVSAPAKLRRLNQYHLLNKTKAALETDPGAPAYGSILLAAQSATHQELHSILANAVAETGAAIRGPSDSGYTAWLVLLLAHTNENLPLPESIEPGNVRADAKRLADAMRGDAQFAWFRGVLLDACALRRPRQPGEPLKDICLVAYNTASQFIDEMGVPNRPSAIDQLAQWVFLLGVPLAPYLLWVAMSSQRQVFRLEDDGSLAFPGGRWPSQDIADIDMSQWISQSVSHLVHRDGTRLKLDDFHYQNLFEIVGAFAARFYPEKWTVDARRVDGERVEPAGDPPPAVNNGASSSSDPTA